MPKANLHILNAIPDGACLVDEHLNIVFWNTLMQRWSGLAEQDVVGKNLSALFPKLKEDSYQLRINQVLQGGAPAVFSKQLHHGLFDFHGESGALQPQRVTLSHVLSEKGKPMALFLVQDMSLYVNQMEKYEHLIEEFDAELKQRHELERNNQMLVSAIEHADEALIVMRCTGEIVYINPAFSEQTGWSAKAIEQAAPFYYHQLFVTAIDQSHIRNLTMMAANWQGRKKIKHRDGESFTASISISPIQNAGEQVSHVVVVQENINEQLQLEEHYRTTQKQEALATLIGGIAHDFNNLLSGMMGHLYLANREVQGLPKTVERIHRVQHVVNDIAAIVARLMTFARKGGIEQQKFPLNSFLKEFVKLAEHAVPEYIHMNIDFEFGEFPCLGDVDRLQESLMNMVQNAVDAVDALSPQQEAEIRIHLSVFDKTKQAKWLKRHPALKEGKFAQITIWDNGRGIDADIIDRVFDPFFTTQHLGSGLGLSVAAGNIKQMNGLYDVTSDASGTCIFVWLPLLDSEENVEEVATGRAARGQLILVVDDEHIIRDTCAEVLISLGYQVITANNGYEAIAQMEAHGERVDCVLMDMIMPKMNGSVAAGHIREMYPNVPVIFATAYDKALSIDATRQFEQAMLISKPFAPHAIHKHIKAMTQKATPLA